MHYWLGALFFAIGAYLFVSAFRHRRRVRAAWAAAGLPGPRRLTLLDPPTMGSLGESLRPLLLFFVALVAVQIVAFYVFFDGDQVMSPADVGGIVFLIVAWGTWMSLRVGYRMSDLDRHPAPAAAPPSEAEASDEAPEAEATTVAPASP